VRQLTLSEQIQHIVKEIAKRFPETAAAMGEQQLRRFLQVYKANTNALFSYIPRPYRGPAHLVFFRAETRDRYNPPNPQIPWINVCPSLEVREVPGTHRTMTMVPHVRILVEQLTVSLQHCRQMSAAKS
jgi:thioesterase domain-containing protein